MCTWTEIGIDKAKLIDVFWESKGENKKRKNYFISLLKLADSCEFETILKVAPRIDVGFDLRLACLVSTHKLRKTVKFVWQMV